MRVLRAVSERRRYLLPVFGLSIVALLAGFWFSSRLPSAYSVASMGEMDTGGAPIHMHGATRSVADLVADPDRQADVVYELVARQGRVELADGAVVDGYSLNGGTPGPTIQAIQGQLVEVRVRNEDVSGGMTLHWHGVDVPNGSDGVAGVTQDAIGIGQQYTYRFVADQVGTYWYHSHQMSHEQSLGGLIGPVVVLPSERPVADVDQVALIHTYAGVRTINGAARDTSISAEPGDTVRVRVINTDNGPIPVWVPGVEFRVMAVDGYEVNQPDEVIDRSVLVTAGGRADLEFTAPGRVQIAGASLLVGRDGPSAVSAPQEQVDFLSYGQPAPIGLDPTQAARDFRYEIGRRPGLLDGKPGMWWTINDRMYPDVPMFMVQKGDVARFTITNNSGEVHPMHLHGHHMVVLSRNGVPASGSPWWVDSLNVADGESYETAFLADNPGIWMDHCHNLPHASQGLVAHLMYAGVDTPFVVGGDHDNDPE